MTGLTIEALRKALEEMEKRGDELGIHPKWIGLPITWLLSAALVVEGVSPFCVWRGLR